MWAGLLVVVTVAPLDWLVQRRVDLLESWMVATRVESWALMRAELSAAWMVVAKVQQLAGLSVALWAEDWALQTVVLLVTSDDRLAELMAA